MTTYFISGHGDITEDEFVEHYVPGLQLALDEGSSFVLGDFRGADVMAQQWLRGHAQELSGEIHVFHMFTKARYTCGWPTTGGFKSDAERDRAMTETSDADIAWVRSGKESSCTARNLKRRG